MSYLRLGVNPEDRSHEVAVDTSVLLDHTLVIGARGSGKSTLGRSLLDGVLDLGVPALIIDTTGDITARLADSDELSLLQGFSEPAPPGSRIRLRSLGLEFIEGLFLHPESQDAFPDALSDELEDLVAALLGVAGFRPKKQTPEFALIENLVFRAWSDGRSILLSELVELIEHPDIDRIGVFPLDTVISADRRADLAAALAHLLWSLPADSSDAHPQLIEIGALLYDNDAACGTVLSFAGGGDRIQKFHLAVLLAKLKTYAATHWTHDDDVDAVLYIDEASNLLPNGRKRLTTAPLLEILDGQVPGVGLALVAEELADLHEDVEDLCGTWVVGRIPSLEARLEVIHSLDLVNPPVDEVALEKTIKTQPAGHFVVRSLRLQRLLHFQLD